MFFQYSRPVSTAYFLQLESEGIIVPPEVVEAAPLTAYAWEARYPGLSEPVTIEEYREALRQAELVVSWAAKVIKESKESKE